MHQEETPNNRRLQFRLAIAAFCVLVVGLFYCLTIAVRGAGLYADITRLEKRPMESAGRYVGGFGRFDPVLGYVLLEHGTGAWLIAGGEPVPFFHDDEGRRVAKGVEHGFQGDKHPRILFLGDSFTYGELVAAEDAFPARVAAELGGESINAGVPGYGLAQMTLLAERLVAKYKPDYVVAQYSDWLPARSMSEFATDRQGEIMAPYIYERGDEVGVASVPFNPPESFVSQVEKYKASRPGTLEKISFIGEVAFPFFFNRDVGLAWLRIRQWVGVAPRPSSDTKKITRFSYAEMDRIARKNGSTLIILALGLAKPFHVPGDDFPAGVAGVNAWRAMVEMLDTGSLDEYEAKYYFWRGYPPRPVDAHPNEWAHKVIADVVAERIRLLQGQQGQKQ